jgi:hypothetical protein
MENLELRNEAVHITTFLRIIFVRTLTFEKLERAVKLFAVANERMDFFTNFQRTQVFDLSSFPFPIYCLKIIIKIKEKRIDLQIILCSHKIYHIPKMIKEVNDIRVLIGTYLILILLEHTHN